MKTLKLTDEELDILQNNLLYLIEDEENNNSLSRDEEYLQNLKSLYLKVSDRDIPKPNEGYKRLGLSTDEIGNFGIQMKIKEFLKFYLGYTSFKLLLNAEIDGLMYFQKKKF